ncbi:hypothetical protein Tco_0888870 [Tanacetum coccineum]
MRPRSCGHDERACEFIRECHLSPIASEIGTNKAIKASGRRFLKERRMYVVPTGRVIATDSVIVATSGYVVPAAYDISPGRVKLKDLSRVRPTLQEYRNYTVSSMKLVSVLDLGCSLSL